MGSIGVSDYSYESEKAAPSQVLLLTCGDVALNPRTQNRQRCKVFNGESLAKMLDKDHERTRP